jgi:hypothetical protein
VTVTVVLKSRVKRSVEEYLGKNDFKSVKIDGKCMHVQKRLILGNLKEINSKFKSDCPEVKISFSKFCELLDPTLYSGWGFWNTFCLCMYNTSEC